MLVVVPALAQQTLDRPVDGPIPYQVDSGNLANVSASPQALHEEVVHIDGAAWLRVYFGDVVLGAGSVLRITSELDGEVQVLDAQGLVEWKNTTAYFNGQTVRVELVGGAQTPNNRLVIDQVAWEASPEVFLGSCGICGPDDRIPTEEDFAARLLPAGCSATVFNQDSCMVSAGHCMGSSMVLQFRVPPSTPGCGLVHPPIIEQFPAATQMSTNSGPGHDWAVMTMGTNNAGEKPYERYGVRIPIADSPPSVGDSLTIWGYGVDNECVRNQVQQSSSGTLSGVNATSIRHGVDATFGNSGSAVNRNGTEILAIVTHCPCPNWATRVDHPAFVAARETLCPSVVPSETIPVSADVPPGWGTLVSGGLPEIGSSDNTYLVVESEEGGPRNNAMTVVDLQSPFNSVSELNLRVEFGAADAQPVYGIFQIFNWDTDEYKTLSIVVVPTTTDRVYDFDDIAGADAYVNGSGNIRLRLIQTARLSQTPDGYTKRIDLVEVTVLE
jgi:hypothetical protein